MEHIENIDIAGANLAERTQIQTARRAGGLPRSDDDLPLGANQALIDARRSARAG
jgi:hypothetical protein